MLDILCYIVLGFFLAGPILFTALTIFFCIVVFIAKLVESGIFQFVFFLGCMFLAFKIMETDPARGLLVGFGAMLLPIVASMERNKSSS